MLLNDYTCAPMCTREFDFIFEIFRHVLRTIPFSAFPPGTWNLKNVCRTTYPWFLASLPF